MKTKNLWEKAGIGSRFTLFSPPGGGGGGGGRMVLVIIIEVIWYKWQSWMGSIILDSTFHANYRSLLCMQELTVRAPTMFRHC